MDYNKLKKYQADVVHLLDNSIKKNRLVHIYLFHGEKGTMKKEASLYLASKILGMDIKNMDEDSLKSLGIFSLSPEKETIKKEQITDLLHEFSLTHEEKRIFIIDDIDKATTASSNSLLKFLEETKDNVYGILLTENINLVLPTIISRSQVVRFNPINKDVIYELLLEEKVNEEVSSVLSSITNNLDEALVLSKDKMFIETLELVKRIGMSFEDEKLDPIIVMADSGRFIMNEGSKTYHNLFIDMLTTLQSDKVKKLLNSNGIIFKTLLNSSTITLPLEVEIKILEIVMELKSKIKYNINMELAYLEMLIAVKRC